MIQQNPEMISGIIQGLGLSGITINGRQIGEEELVQMGQGGR